MPTITVRLSNSEFSRLEAIASASTRSKSEIVREALAIAHGKFTSLVDALSGAADLSTNKARMEGYGASRLR